MENQQPYENEVDLVEYIKVIYKHRLMIFIVVLFSMVIAGLMSMSQPPFYQSTATFFPLYSSPKIQTEDIVIKPGPDIKDLIISVLESRKMADRIIEQLNLKKIWSQKFMMDTREILNKASEVTLAKNGIIKLSVQTKSPSLSADIANAYVDNLDYFNSQLDIGAQRQIVQVIDRATVPEERMPRGTITKISLTGIVFFMFSIVLAFLIEFFRKNKLIARLKET